MTLEQLNDVITNFEAYGWRLKHYTFTTNQLWDFWFKFGPLGFSPLRPTTFEEQIDLIISGKKTYRGKRIVIKP